MEGEREKDLKNTAAVFHDVTINPPGSRRRFFTPLLGPSNHNIDVCGSNGQTVHPHQAARTFSGAAFDRPPGLALWRRRTGGEARCPDPSVRRPALLIAWPIPPVKRSNGPPHQAARAFSGAAFDRPPCLALWRRRTGGEANSQQPTANSRTSRRPNVILVEDPT